jgi:plasmid stabilization system protein ParE
MPHVRLSVRAQSDLSRLHAFLFEKDAHAAKRALLAIREAFVPLKQSPLIGRPMEDRTDLRELVIDFGTTGYLALYCYEPPLDVVTILAVKHQREDDYKGG